VKDAFHAYVIKGDTSAVNAQQVGTKMAALHRRELGAGESMTLKLRLTDMEPVGGMEGNSPSNAPKVGAINGPAHAEHAEAVPGARILAQALMNCLRGGRKRRMSFTPRASLRNCRRMRSW